MQAAITKHSDSTRGVSGHGEGPPDGWTFAALMVELGKTSSTEVQPLVADWLQKHPPKSAELNENVLCCRLERPFKSERRRNFFRLKDQTLMDLINDHFKTLSDFKPYYGQAPRGKNERDAQENINKIEKRGKRKKK